MSNENQEPRIIVDDDWKAQVEREKEELRKQANKSKSAEHGEELPPASIPWLVTTFATQALASLGYLPDPITREVNVNRPLAKHCIDMLSVLEEKMKGNLTADESSMLTDALHQLRMAFVASADQKPGEGPARPKSTVTHERK